MGTDGMTQQFLLSRTAESLYWMARYVERADSTARLIEMGHRMAMLPGSYSRREWRSVAAASGCLDAFPDPDGITEADIVKTLLLDAENPSSIRACLERARANGRAVRTSLSRQMWEAVNEGWRTLELMDPQEAQRDLPGVLDWVKVKAATIRGAAISTLLRNDGYLFQNLGTHIERADMTLRLLSVKAFVLLPETDVIGGERDYHQWTSVLYATSAQRAHHHVYRGEYNPTTIADFLILYPRFPRSVAYNCIELSRGLDVLAETYGARHDCHEAAAALVAELRRLTMAEIFRMGLTEFLRDTIGTMNRLNGEIHLAYHF